MGNVPHNKNLDFMTSFKQIATLLGIPEDLMQFSRFTMSFSDVVKSACLNSKDEEIQSMVQNCSKDFLFPYSISVSDDLVKKIVAEIQTNNSRFYRPEEYKMWVNGFPSDTDFRNHYAIRVNKEKGHVLMQKFNLYDAPGRFAAHIRYYVNKDGNLVEDELTESHSHPTSRHIVSNIRNQDITEVSTTYDSYNFSKSEHTYEGGDYVKTSKVKQSTSFNNLRSQIFPDKDIR